MPPAASPRSGDGRVSRRARMSASTLSGTRTSAASCLATHRSPRARRSLPRSACARLPRRRVGCPRHDRARAGASCGGQVVDRQQRAEQRARLLLGEWLEVDAARLHPARSPAPAGCRAARGATRQMTSSGASRVQVTRYSIRSSSGGSAQWMSSKTSTSGPRAAIRCSTRRRKPHAISRSPPSTAPADASAGADDPRQAVGRRRRPG